MDSAEKSFFNADAKKYPEYKRLAFSAVPLDPWAAEHPLHPGIPYHIASLNHIEEIADKSFELPSARGLTSELKELVKISLWSAQSQRLQYNHDNPIPKALRVADSRIERACQGYASPEELLDIFLDYPQMHALELAKLSHPFDSSATAEMTEMMALLLDRRLGAQTPTGNLHYKMKHKDVDIPALIVDRKVSSNINMRNEQLCVVERKSFLCRGDTAAITEYEVAEQKRLVRSILNDERLSELIDRIEVDLSQGELPTCLQPLTTSYYIHRV